MTVELDPETLLYTVDHVIHKHSVWVGSETLSPCTKWERDDDVDFTILPVI